MSPDSITTVLAISSFLPALVAVVKTPTEAATVDGPRMAALGIAVVGVGYALYDRSSSSGWHIDLSGALWASAAATLIVLAGVSLTQREGWRIATLAVPYATALGALAAARDITMGGSGEVLAAGPSAWLAVHAVLSVATYAIATVGAMAASAGWMQQRALKQKTPTAFSRRLPSLAACDRIQTRLMALCAVVLGLGLITGAATSIVRDGVLVAIDHKTVFGLLAFLLIIGLLFADRRGSLRTRQVGRTVLVAYLLLTLAYIGVKFVTDIVL